MFSCCMIIVFDVDKEIRKRNEKKWFGTSSCLICPAHQNCTTNESRYLLFSALYAILITSLSQSSGVKMYTLNRVLNKPKDSRKWVDHKKAKTMKRLKNFSATLIPLLYTLETNISFVYIHYTIVFRDCFSLLTAWMCFPFLADTPNTFRFM